MPKLRAADINQDSLRIGDAVAVVADARQFTWLGPDFDRVGYVNLCYGDEIVSVAEGRCYEPEPLLAELLFETAPIVIGGGIERYGMLEPAFEQFQAGMFKAAEVFDTPDEALFEAESQKAIPTDFGRGYAGAMRGRRDHTFRRFRDPVCEWNDFVRTWMPKWDEIAICAIHAIQANKREPSYVASAPPYWNCMTAKNTRILTGLHHDCRFARPIVEDWIYNTYGHIPWCSEAGPWDWTVHETITWDWPV
jgi:hypothetical protein